MDEGSKDHVEIAVDSVVEPPVFDASGIFVSLMRSNLDRVASRLR